MNDQELRFWFFGTCVAGERRGVAVMDERRAQIADKIVAVSTYWVARITGRDPTPIFLSAARVVLSAVSLVRRRTGGTK